MKNQPTAIIVGASSDIGTALCEFWKRKGWKIAGTYRNLSSKIRNLKANNIEMVRCDVSNPLSIKTACESLKKHIPKWDILVNATGDLKPVSPFNKSEFDTWENSVVLNFSSQMRIIHTLLPSRNTQNSIGPGVLLFAGGGTNNATTNYSAYTISKIALIKMCEILDAEIPDTRFSIIGPGWVNTKIHKATLQAGSENAGEIFDSTQEMILGDTAVPMEQVLASCDWLVNQPRNIVGGRNFSTAHDDWGTTELNEALKKDPNMYKLRRFGNDWNKH